MMVQRLVERYFAGAITADHLFIQCLHMIDPRDPGVVLSALPDRLLGGFREFVEAYHPGRMVTTYGILPATDQVEAAANWLMRLGRGHGAGTTST